MQSFQKNITCWVFAVFIAVVASPHASASPVSVVGGFRGYNGPAGCGQFVTFIHGIDETQQSGCDPMTLTAPLSLLFSPTSSVEFYSQQFGVDNTHNNLTFTPAPTQEVSGQGIPFLLGTLSFTNGSWFGSNSVATFPITLTTVSMDPVLNGKILDDSLTLFITPNMTSNTPAQNADAIYFTNFPGIGTAEVPELDDSIPGSNIGTFDVYGKIDSLIPTSFANARGAGFIEPDITQAGSSTPEPGGMALTGLCLALLTAGLARKSKAGDSFSRHFADPRLRRLL